MTKQVQRRRGTAAQHTSFTGAEGEISVNTTNKSVHVHDGVTAGGVEAARADLGNVSDANLNAALSGNTLASLTITSADINGGTIDGTVIGGSTPAAISGTTGTFSGNLTVDTNTLFVDAANNRVGVGTTSPESALHIASASGSNAQLRVITGDTTSVSQLIFGDSADSNTGGLQYNHSDDSLQFHVGNIGEKMRLNSSGNVGIGTSSPAATLDASKAHTSGGLAGVVANPQLAVSNPQNWGRPTGMLFKAPLTSGGALSNNAAVWSEWSSDSNAYLAFATNGSGTLAERLRITSTGSVGIGTSSPAAKLHISGADTVFRIQDTNGGTSFYGHDSVGAYHRSFTSDTFRFLKASGNEAMRIDSSGNVGIGTSSPAAVFGGSGGGLDAAGYVIARGAISAHQTNAAVIQYLSNAMTLRPYGATAGTGFIVFNTGGGGGSVDAERMRIDSSGRVGIGTTSPSDRVSIVGGGIGVEGSTSGFTGGEVRLGSSASSTQSAISTTSTGTPEMYFDHRGTSTGVFVWRSLSSERMRIDSSGNLLVGKTSTTYNTSGGVMYAGGAGQFTASGNRAMYLNRLSTDGDILQFDKDGTTVGSIGVNGQRPYIGSSLVSTDANLKFTDVQILPCDATGANTDGTDDIGASAARFKDLYLSGGVYLGGTGAANLLDYYEEGTSTIGISAASGSGGTISSGAMSWTRIGNQVIVAGNFSVSSLGTLSGAFFITGFPFTSSANFFQSQGSVRSQGIGGADDIPVVIEMSSGTAYARMHFSSGSGTQRTVQVSDISVSDFMAFGLTYQI